MKELTRDNVTKHGWNELSVITADMIKEYGYTSIGEYAFYNCKNLVSITLPNSITNIRRSAFFNCYKLAFITIPNSVISIGNYAFTFCHSLTSVIIPNSVINIGNNAFTGCNSLTSVTIGNGTTGIGDCTFAFCNNLISIIIPNSIKIIGFRAFGGCKIKLPKKYDAQGRLIAYKGFNKNMQCRNFQYAEGQTYETYKAELCKCGFHACTNPLDVFTYYAGEIGKDMFIHEVYLEEVNDEEDSDSKIVANKITIGKRLTIKDINKIIQNENINR